jgi:hypothetical protein
MDDEKVVSVSTEDPKVLETNEWIGNKKNELEQRVLIRQEYEQLFEIWKAKELVALEKRNEEVITEGLKKYYDKWLEEQKPPTPEDIQQLLDQEYETFALKVQVEDGNGEYTTELFTIRELPQVAEKKFYRQFKDRVLNKTTELQAFTQESIDQPFETKAKAFLGLLDESFDMIADTVVIVLNPFGKKKHIDRDWVQMNISSNRQWSIIEGQLKVNRVKDFFSRLSQSGQQTQMMMTGQRFQQLQQFVR